jgi:endoglucanase
MTLRAASPRRSAALLPVQASFQPPPAPPPGLAADWTAFKRRFLAPEGRVIDTGNGGISHSEGQSYAMLVAERLDDRAAFDLAWRWAARRLRRPQDALHAWRFDPYRAQVTDRNNATDGDLVMAWALARGARRWGDAAMEQAAIALARDILEHCTVAYADRTLLLPGAAGFRHADRVVLNASYFAFNAFRALSRLLPDRRWALLEAGALDVLGAARFGRWGLPPDWADLRPDGLVGPALGRPPRFAWDAIRVPLHLAWAGIEAPVLRAAVEFWLAHDLPHRPPAWTDLRSNETSPYPGHAGVRAVVALAAWRLGLAGPPPRIPVASAPDYYAASLVLLCAVAASEPPEPPADPGDAPAEERGLLRSLMDALGLGEEEVR